MFSHTNLSAKRGGWTEVPANHTQAKDRLDIYNELVDQKLPRTNTSAEPRLQTNIEEVEQKLPKLHTSTTRRLPMVA